MDAKMKKTGGYIQVIKENIDYEIEQREEKKTSWNTLPQENYDSYNCCSTGFFFFVSCKDMYGWEMTVQDGTVVSAKHEKITSACMYSNDFLSSHLILHSVLWTHNMQMHSAVNTHSQHTC